MSANGEHIDTVDTLTPGTLEFVPNRAGQKHRHVTGERFHVVYTAANQIDTFHVNKATTRTDNEPRNGKPTPPGITTSSELQAYFAPGSGEMTRLEQWGDFRYEEASAGRAASGRCSIRLRTGSRCCRMRGFPTTRDQRPRTRSCSIRRARILSPTATCNRAGCRMRRAGAVRRC